MDAPFSPDVLDELTKYDSPTICNIIELFDCRARNVGYAHADIRAMYPQLPPMVGYAVTATFRSAHAPEAGEPCATLPDQIEAFSSIPKPWVVVIQDLDHPLGAAVYGEVMVSTYKGFGAVGLVTNGYGRDILQIEPLNFACFTAGAAVSHAYCRVIDTQVPVEIGGLTVKPGDLLHGDANGLTNIPKTIVNEVAGACAEFVDAEEVIVQAARQKNPDLDTYRKAVQEFGKRRAALTDRLRKGTAGGDDGDALA
jgi:regulator of RNase E activity RraA